MTLKSQKICSGFLLRRQILKRQMFVRKLLIFSMFKQARYYSLPKSKANFIHSFSFFTGLTMMLKQIQWLFQQSKTDTIKISIILISLVLHIQFSSLIMPYFLHWLIFRSNYNHWKSTIFWRTFDVMIDISVFDIVKSFH